MNAVVRALTQPRLSNRLVLSSQQMLVVWTMAILLLLSALGIVFVKDRYRRHYFDYQTLEQKQVGLEQMHNRLLLENATRLAQSRLAEMAKKQGMVVPSDKQIIWLHESQD